jgi:hypothetical protein
MLKDNKNLKIKTKMLSKNNQPYKIVRESYDDINVKKFAIFYPRTKQYEKFVL